MLFVFDSAMPAIANFDIESSRVSVPESDNRKLLVVGTFTFTIGAVIAGVAVALAKGPGEYLCRPGEGQIGQNYWAGDVGTLDACKSKCAADESCMGLDFPTNAGSPRSCRLYGANAPRLNDGGPQKHQYCVRLAFASENRAALLPGEPEFVPTKEWLSKSLGGVPLSQLSVKKFGGEGNQGVSGASFFKCAASFDGPAVNPTFGLPTGYFLKIRSAAQGVNEFAIEGTVDKLAKHLPHPPPLARMFSLGQNHMLMEDAGVPLDGNYTFSEAEMIQVLDSYADLHVAFWNIPEVESLRPAEWWGAVFTGSFLGKEEMDRWLDWRLTPEPYLSLIRRARDELGFERIFAFMNTHGVTLAQGDAHNGQLLRLKEPSASTYGGRTFGLIDFGTAVRANPAVDIGSIMRFLSADKREGEFDFVRYYLKEVRMRLGEHATALKVTDEEFFHDYKVGKLFRILFEGTFQWMSLSDEVKNNADYLKDKMDDPRLQDYFREISSFDEEEFRWLQDQLAKSAPMKSRSFGSGAGPSQFFVDAMASREGWRLRHLLEVPANITV